MQTIIDEHDPVSVPLPLPIHITPPRLNVIRCHLCAEVPAWRAQDKLVSCDLPKLMDVYTEGDTSA